MTELQCVLGTLAMLPQSPCRIATFQQSITLGIPL